MGFTVFILVICTKEVAGITSVRGIISDISSILRQILHKTQFFMDCNVSMFYMKSPLAGTVSKSQS